MKRSCIPERLGMVEVLSLNIHRNLSRDVVASPPGFSKTCCRRQRIKHQKKCLDACGVVVIHSKIRTLKEQGSPLHLCRTFFDKSMCVWSKHVVCGGVCKFSLLIWRSNSYHSACQGHYPKVLHDSTFERIFYSCNRILEMISGFPSRFPSLGTFAPWMAVCFTWQVVVNFGAIEDYLAEPNLRLLKMHNLRQSPMRLKGYVFHDLYHIHIYIYTYWFTYCVYTFIYSTLYI